MVNVGSDEPAQIVTKLRQALDAVNRLSAERAALEEALKVEKNKDNILPRIMAVSGSYDRLFAEELKKYEPLKVHSETLSACASIAVHMQPKASTASYEMCILAATQGLSLKLERCELLSAQDQTALGAISSRS